MGKKKAGRKADYLALLRGKTEGKRDRDLLQTTRWIDGTRSLCQQDGRKDDEDKILR